MIDTPGRPAQLVMLGQRLLVSIRQMLGGGGLVAYDRSGSGFFAEMDLVLATIDVPSTKSAMPKSDEWKEAKLARPSRHPPETRSCAVAVLREYARVSCPFSLPALGQLAGVI
jgi:hypothetical protein